MNRFLRWWNSDKNTRVIVLVLGLLSAILMATAIHIFLRYVSFIGEW